MIALALPSGLRRSSNGFRITYIDAQLDALPPPPEPTLVIVWATPGFSWVILSTLAMTSLVSSRASASGNWRLAISRPWSISGMKPVGTTVNAQHVKPTRPR